ncbi:MAG: TIGR02757 family protein [Candidatus Hydrogenedentes bacterium]|nr:TIGR02757 family protein [Candidatus Hydrogenedentota bacterium]
MARHALSPSPRTARIAGALESLYAHYNARGFVYPDPLAPVLRFTEPRDQEIAGLIAASLAFGNVKTILASVDAVLAHLPQPYADVMRHPPAHWNRVLKGFRHRYVGGAEMAGLVCGIRRVLIAYGSLEACFCAGLRAGDTHSVGALAHFVEALQAEQPLEKNYLLPHPARGSACKRHFMYLRWMVRHDAVDLGLWPGVAPRLLVYPMDTHLYRMARLLQFTRRKTADLKTALEVTGRFARICPEDPVRYDFCLTRLGIRREDEADFWAQVRGADSGQARGKTEDGYVP